MPNGLGQLLTLLVFVAFGYLLLIRPARKRAQEASALQSALSTGDDVMLTSGLFGRVEAIIDDTVRLEISPDVVVTVHRGAIGKIVRNEPAYDVEATTDEPSAAPADEAAGSSTPPARRQPGDGTGFPAADDAETDSERNRGAI